MKLRLPEPKIAIGTDGFDQHCKLGRQDMGRKLSELLETVGDPIVVAVDGPWGSGKSHFLKCWCGEHKNKFNPLTKIVYFDAFKHDYLDDPLIALTLALDQQLEVDESQKHSLKALRKAVILGGKPIARVGLSVFTAGLSEFTGPVVDALLSATGDQADTLIEKLWKKEVGRISAMEDFGNALKALTRTGQEGEESVIIVIDELDRCRPDYALLLLEIIKHFFSVPNIKFVLGVNLKELSNSVQARYGSSVDSNSYLQKFIDIRLKLETSLQLGDDGSEPRTYFRYVADSMGLDDSKYRAAIETHLEIWGAKCPLTLREIERLVSAAVLTPSIRNQRHIGRWMLVGGLLTLKIGNPVLFEKLRNGSASFDEICVFFALPTVASDDTRDHIRELVSVWYFLTNNEFIEVSQEIPSTRTHFGFNGDATQLLSSLFAGILDVFESESLLT